MLEYSPPTPCELTRKTIEDFTSKLSESLGVSPGDDLLSVVSSLGGKVHTVDNSSLDESTDGSIVVHGLGDFDVYLSRDSGQSRSRFTLAHELGHYILHFVNGNQQPIRAQRYGSDSAEKEANWFAAAFLMPTEPFKAEFNLSPSIAGVADHFGVSRPAATIRAEYLKLI